MSRTFGVRRVSSADQTVDEVEGHEEQEGEGGHYHRSYPSATFVLTGFGSHAVPACRLVGIGNDVTGLIVPEPPLSRRAFQCRL